jgi:hypothetical protein
MISCAYTLVYLCGVNLPWHELNIEHAFEANKEHYFKMVSDLKLKLPAKEICKDEAKWLVRFFSEVNKLEFDEEPNYGLLRHLLTSVILDEG